MKIDDKAIRKLAALLDETGLNEIEVVEGEQAIRVNKGGTVLSGGHSAPRYAMESDPTAPHPANLKAPSATVSDHPGAVASPMVGTAYLKPSPESPTFVSKGSTVNAGDTLLIIEAMKVMNPIKAHKAGTVTQILIENAKPVEFGDVLMVIE